MFLLLVHVLSIRQNIAVSKNSKLKTTKHEIFGYKVIVQSVCSATEAMCVTSSVLITESFFPPLVSFPFPSFFSWEKNEV